MKYYFVLFLGWSVHFAQAFELSGQVDLEHRQFSSHGNKDNQVHQTSLKLEPEFYFDDIFSNTSLLVAPFLRVDSLDSTRTHSDIREFMFLHLADEYEFRAGIGKVFWGVTESLHLVDVINQTDLLEGVDSEDKLGQPMLNLTFSKEWGTVGIFVLPYFRQMEFASEEGRLGLPFDVDNTDPTYESSKAARHIDTALRYSHYYDDWEVGVSYFSGTNREAYFMQHTDGVAIPHYAQMTQFSIDFQGVIDSWLLKLEAIQRNSIATHHAYVVGVEYSHSQILNTRMDFGTIVEYQFDSRNGVSAPMGQNDIFLGGRLTVNDMAGTEVLAGISLDLDDSGTSVFKLEASQRLSDVLRVAVEGYLFSSDEPTNVVYVRNKEDFLQLTLELYF
ncbi:hypothetical protein [Pseudoalteromonas sp. MMG005]|uniref:hypothetical protein n=1 Tax=Pseudoalteromonas sp. MMG005 TaxID=2822682 RepID=UPI001B3A648A|nr:hypothetical protein [Pseudoalteromonas sp. MMG005]MBQ4844005.1 hypothetical protein [Pseudoalteromonas sp. MMG005]